MSDIVVAADLQVCVAEQFSHVRNGHIFAYIVEYGQHHTSDSMVSEKINVVVRY